MALDGLNISTGKGDGSADVMQWGAFDKASDRLYNEQLQRKLKAEQEALRQQAMFQSELGKIRSVDVPEVVDLYNKRKAINQQVLFDKNLQKNPVAFAQAQLAARKADADFYRLVNSSKETMAFDKDLNDDIAKSPDLYTDDAHGRLSEAYQIPTSKRLELGMNNRTPYLYTGTNTDFGALDKMAMGELKPIYGKEFMTENKEQYGTPSFNAYNTPAQYKEIYLDQLGKRGAGRDAGRLLNQIPMQAFDQVNKQYDAIPASEWAKWGVEKQDLEPKNPESLAEQYASYQAKKYALNNIPKPGETKYRANSAFIRDELQKDRLQLEGVRQAGRMRYLKAQQDFKTKSQQEQDSWLENYITSQYNEAKGDGRKGFEYKTKDGAKTYEYEMKVSPLTKKIFVVQDENGKDVYPDRIRIMANGDVHPIFFKRDKDGKQIQVNGNYAVNETRSQPVSKTEYKVRLGQQLLSDKGLDRELSDEFGDGVFDDGGEELQITERVQVPVRSQVTDPELLKILNGE